MAQSIKFNDNTFLDLSSLGGFVGSRSNIDLNTLTTSGIYVCVNCTNCPEQTCIVVTLAWSDRAVQFAFSPYSDKIYKRNLYNSWGTWKSITLN